MSDKTAPPDQTDAVVDVDTGPDVDTSGSAAPEADQLRTDTDHVMRRGFGLLGRGISEQRWLFTVSVVGSVVFGATTVADAWVLGWATDHVIRPVVPARRGGSGRPRRGGAAVHDGRGAPRARRHRPASRGRRRLLPPRRGVPPTRHPSLPGAPDGLAPPPPHRPAALQRQRRRRGGLGGVHAVAHGDRRDRDARRRRGGDAAGRRRAHDRGPGRVPGPVRHQRVLPALAVAEGRLRAVAPRRRQRGRARVVRRCARRQVARPRDRRDQPLRPSCRAAARRQHRRRTHPQHLRPAARGPAQPRRPGRHPAGHRPRRLGRCRRRRRRAGRVPVHGRRLPGARHRLGARRAATQRRRLGPGPPGARRVR